MNDICLILEGTYPYITGGVSSWIHDILTSLPEFSFEIITLVPSKDYIKETKYKVPSNVKNITNVYLHDLDEENMKFNMSAQERRVFFTSLWDYIDNLMNDRESDLRQVSLAMKRTPPSVADILKSYEGWQFFHNIYTMFYKETSFVDFFWTFRFIAFPFISLLQVKPVEAKCYHTICTGYAGFLASVLKFHSNRPLLLTEHGIYTKERLMEIVDAEWIHSQKKDSFDISRELPPLKKLWINMFIGLGRITYDSSEKIITLYKGNQDDQLKFGAQKEKCMIIPNGISPERFEIKREVVSKGPVYHVGFVGRVVPIKDIKTLIRSARLVVDRLPGCEFLILGPTDEDEEYFLECKSLVEILNLKNNFKFLGSGDVTVFYPRIDLLILTSISEAQPLVILEAHACKIPVVSTDAGSAAELLNGKDDEDKALGPGGLIAPAMNSAQIALSVIKLLTDSDKNRDFGNSGYERTLKYYTKTQLMDSYRDIYKEAINWQE